MKDKPAREKILETALKLISEEGYSDLSTREIARKAGVSDGTLYYHFPKGKTNILESLASELSKRLEIDEILADGIVTEEEIQKFFMKDLDMARKMREFIIAMEIELLSNPDYYMSLSEKFANIKEIESFQKIVEAIIGHEISRYTMIKIISVWKALIRRHVIFRNLYGSDHEFIDMLIKFTKILGDE